MKLKGVWRGFTDRDNWPPGEWDHEPDKVEWIDDDTGLPCIIHRGRTGAWCGYVGVAPDHPYHGRHDYDQVPVEVHGGLTYAAPCNPHDDDDFGVCHKAEPGEPDDVWWLGFDCAHAGDEMPGLIWVTEKVKVDHPGLNYPEGWATYKNQEYVMEECKLLALQLANMSGPTTTT